MERPANKCRARRTSGAPCGSYAIHGGSVCRIHGGAAPQVKRAAEERILAMVDPALTRLAQLINDDLSGVALAAVKDILDRAGYSPKTRIEITLKQQAAQLAADLGLDPEELLAEAERIVAGSR